MKVLIIHNWYGSSAPSGENEVVKAEINLLRINNVKVIEYFKFSDSIINLGLLGKIIGGFSTIFNPVSYFKVKKLILKELPDVVHIHNFFPLISSSVIYAVASTNTPLVMTLHNYRIVCGAGLPFRDSKICTKCINSHSPLSLLIYRCYRNSLFASIPLAIMIYVNGSLKTWKNKVDNFIVFTEFQKKILVNSDIINLSQVKIKPQFLINPPSLIPVSERNIDAIFIGRITVEKGVEILLDAWRKWGVSAPLLTIVGSGPDEIALKRKFKDCNVNWVGKLCHDEVILKLRNSKLMIIPSIAFEGFPMVIREALACGVPILSSSVLPLPEIVKKNFGDIFFENTSDSLLSCAKNLLALPPIDLEMKSIAAREEFNNKYTSEINFNILMGIYKDSISKKS